jgi:hypothetical protein
MLTLSVTMLGGRLQLGCHWGQCMASYVQPKRALSVMAVYGMMEPQHRAQACSIVCTGTTRVALHVAHAQMYGSAMLTVVQVLQNRALVSSSSSKAGAVVSAPSPTSHQYMLHDLDQYDKCNWTLPPASNGGWHCMLQAG